MLLLRLSGHSGAGKTRLVNLLPTYGIICPKVVRYTSRPPRPEEIEGQDYYFRSWEFIESLPENDFLVGPVRNMLQAFDLKQLVVDLRIHDLVLIEIYPGLWSGLVSRLAKRLKEPLVTVSVFMTAIDPNIILRKNDEESLTAFIYEEVKKTLTWRNKDSHNDIEIRAKAAVREILEALGPEGQAVYSKIIHSAPEGPDGEDEWTKNAKPTGQALSAIGEFLDFYSTLTRAGM